ncbi:MAG: histidine phosphatase family protein [Armatimonadetes bacterium CG07_land_8_20_14_0_80_59_28]|nr:MAG: histidine phosphatase family protein [Armatimonadetes bacterium CG07_land_8_20_14_0_80_59_28]PIX38777.1 MAG: histidine phosphatase family protein [Armatimonadetes bacterium CG_4_8_14_3_um_filter_58_9]PIY49206.1 MAG: histidine phosphatase family protein [Armatimonadetes bacterium CG_4_10_14_3_um_filter_59_10]PJB70453.1 MAG: histidine phosphatase family protein [Armatimonadetes bacterium CG_4_9_14_3_um_filter_58_7]
MILAGSFTGELAKVKTLMVLRHAKSSWNKPVADDQRPLNKRGKAAATRMGEVIRERGLMPDLIITSTAKRARSTVKRLVESSGYRGESLESMCLYLEGVPQHLATIMAVDDAVDCLLVVGHNPDLESLVMELTGKHEVMSTATLAVIDFVVDSWADIIRRRGRLRFILKPRELME